MQKNKKSFINSTLIFIAIALVIVAFAAYDFYNRDIVPINTYPKGSVVVLRQYRLYPSNYTIVIYKNGDVKKSRIEDHYTESMLEKVKFELVHKLTEIEKEELFNIIESLPNNKTYDDNIDSKGIQVIPTLEATDLKNASEYNQETVDRLENFISKVS